MQEVRSFQRHMRTSKGKLKGNMLTGVSPSGAGGPQDKTCLVSAFASY